MEAEKLTQEMLVRAKVAASAEELMTLAKTYGIALDAQEAKELFAALHERTEYELAETDLDKVVGGSWERPPIRRP